MKKITTLLAGIGLCFSASAQQYDALNMSMYGRFDDTTVTAEPYNGARYSSVWGYADTVNNKEYAILGATSGTYIVDVTNPSSPVKVAFFAGRRGDCLWREYKTYKNYLYGVSDDAAPNSFQIFDLSTPSNPLKVYDSDSIFERSHTIWVDGDKLYGGSVTTKTGYYSMAVYSLADPVKPLLLRTLDQDYPSIPTVHDMFVRNDTVYASCGWNGLYVFKFTGSNFVMLGSLTQYTDQGYNHSSILTPDGKTLVFCDEVPSGLQAKVADVSDLTDIKIKALFKSNPYATAHNPYLLGRNKLVIAYYRDGVQVFDIGNQSSPSRIGYFDTYPSWSTAPSHGTYSGCWGAYVHLPSQVILASDMQSGLFILSADNNILSAGSTRNELRATNLDVYPNPFNDRVNIRFGTENREPVQVRITDVLGHLVHEHRSLLPASGILSLSLPESLAKGAYFITVANGSEASTVKLVK